MYDDDEEDLALLQQYERETGNTSDDDLDSDFEDKLMSAVQYETDATRSWPAASQQQRQQRGQTQQRSDSSTGQLADGSTIPPTDVTQPTTNVTRSDFSSDDNSSISSFDGDNSNEENDDPLDNIDNSNMDSPPIIRHIDLNITDKQLQQEDATDDEEEVLNHELQELIDQQIRKRKHKQSSFRKPKQVPFCFSCLSPGHIQRDCVLCSDCGGERHASNRCPGVFYCHRCKERGHYSIVCRWCSGTDCPNKKCYDSCYHCGEDYHASQCCPKLVHVYKDQVLPRHTPTRWCYNCGKKGHYGDECPTLPESSQSQQSVFSFNSLSIFKDLRINDSTKRRHNLRSPSESSSSKRPRQHKTTPTHQRFSDDSDSDSADTYTVKKGKKNDKRTKKKEKKQRKAKQQNEKQDTKRVSGNNNWKALTKATSSSTSAASTPKIQNDFPRNLPKPSYSGVINTDSSAPRRPKPNFSGVISNEPAPRRPKYSGGYNRH